MKMKPPHSTKKARIEIIPLIDVIFFLLATYVMISLSMTRLLGLEVEYPEAQQKQAVQDKDSDMVTIRITAEDRMLWNEDPITNPDEALPVLLEKYKRENPNPRVLISGEEAATFGKAVKILDIARELGYSPSQCSLNTKAVR